MAAHFEGELISIETAAKARKDRLAVAPTQNPEFDLTDDAVRFSLIETSLYLGIFGEGTEGNARTEWVRTLFGKSPSLTISFRSRWPRDIPKLTRFQNMNNFRSRRATNDRISR